VRPVSSTTRPVTRSRSPSPGTSLAPTLKGGAASISIATGPPIAFASITRRWTSTPFGADTNSSTVPRGKPGAATSI